MKILNKLFIKLTIFIKSLMQTLGFLNSQIAFPVNNILIN